MLIYAGIDEAGYGPMLGPFVVARTVFRVEEAEAGDHQPPCLWEKLRGAVCDTARDKRKRIAVNDSKKLFTPASGVGHLERGVLSFLETLGHEPRTLDQLLKALALDRESGQSELLWYATRDGGPALPSTWTAGQIAIARSQLERAGQEAGVSMADASAAVVFEDRFNHLCETTRSKARCAWTFVAKHLDHVFQTYGEHHPLAVVDQQGGRKGYLQLLQLTFPDAQVQRVFEDSDQVNRYTLIDGERRMTICFESKSEERHLPVALASMTAKYLREMLMVRFNRYWQQHDAALKPTAGYVQDGRRFLADIDPLLRGLTIDTTHLVRQR